MSTCSERSTAFRREDSDDVARLELVHGCQVCVRIGADLIRRETLKLDVDILVDAFDGLVQMSADAGELGTVGAGHQQPVHLATPPHIEQRQRYDAGTLIRTAGAIVDVTGRVFAGSDHQNVRLPHRLTPPLRDRDDLDHRGAAFGSTRHQEPQ
jgi:hypothetical protein